MRASRTAVLALSASLAALVFVACGTKHDSSFDDGDNTGDGGKGFGEDGGFGGEGGAGGNAACSGDLQSIVNKNTGAVIQTCPPDQGCAGGTCVAACDAAKASHGTIGCDYMVATPSFYPGITPPCFAIFVANGWSKPTNVTIQRDGSSYDVTQFGRIADVGNASSWAAVPSTGIPPGKVAVLFMSADPSSANGTPLTCPITPAVNSGTAVIGTGAGKAWHVVSDVPVTAYDILPYGGASSYLPSAELLLPTTAWGTNYFGIVPYRGSSEPQWGQIVATADGTTVQVAPNVNLPGGGTVSAASSGATTSYTLNAGDFIQWSDSQEMSGTVISSDKPVGFTGGLGYDCYSSATSSGGGCDSAHQQIPPLNAFGSLYVAPPFATRMASGAPESIPYRIMAAVDGTTLTYDPPVSGAPTTLAAGQVQMFESTTAFVVKSQDDAHPFYLGQIMPGCEVSGGSRGSTGCLGDEEYVNILPPAQFLTKYAFFTDPTYSTTNLVFVRTKMSSGFQDVKLDCLGTVTGWTPVDAADTYEITNVDIVRDGAPNGSCQNGPQVASSAGAFGVMVWGEDMYASYAYPAGGNVAPINAVVVPPTPR
ncbi:MAG TPA: IgGFc-binding protein [Polyangiaceae bacterium]